MDYALRTIWNVLHSFRVTKKFKQKQNEKQKRKTKTNIKSNWSSSVYIPRTLPEQLSADQASWCYVVIMN